MKAPLAIVHLRHSSGSGGGPEKTLLKSGQLIDRDRFSYRVIYLTNEGGAGAGPVMEKARTLGLDYREFPCPRFIRRSALDGLAAFIGKGPVVIHTHDPKTDVWGLFLRKRLSGALLVSTVHGWIVRTWKSRIYHALESFALRRFDAVVAVSRATEEEARRRGIARTHLIHNAIEPDEWRPLPRPPGPPAVGFVGRISREKGALDFVEAAAVIAARNGEVTFLVAGDGPLAATMRSLARKRGIDGRTQFLGQVPNSDLPSVYARMDVLLSPSHTEGLPNNVLEAGAMAVPVVATDVGGVSDILRDGDNGRLLPRADIAGLARCTLELLADDGIARRMGEAAREIAVRDFSFAARMKKVEALYLSLADGRGGSP